MALDWGSVTAQYLKHNVPILLCFDGFALRSDNNATSWFQMDAWLQVLLYCNPKK